jgi:hypothetical protein
VKGVKEVSIDTVKKIATITLKENASITKEMVVAALSKTRYKVTSFEKK